MSNNAASNVIAMREFDRSTPAPQAAQFERLFRECQDLALDRITRSVSTMLDNSENGLRALADQATEREQRDRYIAAKDKLLGERKAIEEHFRAGLVAEFDTRSKRKSAADYSQYDLSKMELGLVANDDLEETLKVNDMATKLRRYCDEELVALDQRVGVLLGDATLQGDGNPFSPQAILHAFRQASRAVETSLPIRLICLKLFDDHVLDEIRSVYRDLNALLIQRSILPKIRYSVKRAAGGALPGARGPRLGEPSALGPMHAATMGVAASDAAFGDASAYGAEYGGEQDFFATLQSLLARSGGAGAVRPGMVGVPGVPPSTGASMLGGSATQVAGFPPIFGGAGSPAGPGGAQPGGRVDGVPVQLLQGAELVGSLTRIQHGDVGAVAAGNLPLAATLVQPGTTNVLRELKSTSLASGMGQMDAMTLDIVAMLFDQIFDDRRIPAAMKGLIGRLQIPLLKVAILDKNFFSRRTHPARRFMNEMGEFALGLPTDFGGNSPLYKAVEGVVQKLIDEFKDSVDLFDTLYEDLQRVIEEENQRAAAEVRRVAKAIEQKERLEVAKAVAENEIKLRAQSKRMPQVVLKFLAEHWVKLLLIAHAKFGMNSEPYRAAVETMDLLIWSVNSKQSLAERRKLAGALPKLLRRLNQGMQGIAVDEDVRKRFFAKLMRCHTKVINGTMGSTPVGSTPVEAAPAAAVASPAPAAPQHVEHAPVERAASSQAAAVSADAPTTTTYVVDDPAQLLGLTPAATPALDLAQLAAQDAPAERAPTEPLAEVQDLDDTEPAAGLPDFSAVTIKNPFGEGEIEVEEISLSEYPAAPGADGVSLDFITPVQTDDEYGQRASALREGQWVDFVNDDDARHPARLSYISPIKGTYLFVNRQGKKVAEYSLYQLARHLRMGRATILEQVPLFDRAMSSLVGVLKKTQTQH